MTPGLKASVVQDTPEAALERLIADLRPDTEPSAVKAEGVRGLAERYAHGQDRAFSAALLVLIKDETNKPDGRIRMVPCYCDARFYLRA